MKNIISGLIMVVFVVGGAVAADFLKGSPTSHSATEVSQGDDGHGDNGGHGEDKKSKKSSDHGGDDGHGGSDDHGDAKRKGTKYYYDFSRQFVVPVMEKGKVSALVIMDINLEMDQSESDSVYTLEPKLRDALMRGLLSLSDEGAFSGQMTSPEKYERVQKELLKAARTVKDEVQNVLILDIARQDQ